MIVIAYKPGQLANRLFLFAKFLAYGKKGGVRVINPSFAEYAAYFSQTAKQLVPASGVCFKIRLPMVSSAIYAAAFFTARIIHRSDLRLKWITATYLDWDEHFDLDNDCTLARPGLHLIQGWEFDAAVLLSTHRSYIINFFKPAEKFDKEILRFRENLYNKSTLIGVHIRQGDYQYFLNGKYFYTVEDYADQMRRLLRKCPEAHFLICTNNRLLSKSNFEGIPVTFAPGHELVDLYLMATCNYVIGPPSTYSLWASFYGRVPLYQLTDLKAEFDLTHFSVYS